MPAYKQTLIDNDPLNKQSKANMSFTGEPHLKKHKRWCTPCNVHSLFRECPRISKYDSTNWYLIHLQIDNAKA